MMNVESIVHLSRLIFFFLIITPFHIYCTVRLWKHRHEIFFVKRRPFLSLANITLAYIFAFWPMLIQPGSIFNIIGGESTSAETSFGWYFLIGTWYIGGMVCIINSRAWFLVFDLKYNDSAKASKWWSSLDPTLKSFWIKYKHSLGNFKGVMCKYILLFWHIWWFMTLVIWFLTENANYASLFFNSINLTITIGLIVLWNRLPNGIFDVFYIRKELKYFIIIFLMISFFYLGARILDILYTLIGWQLAQIANIGMCLLTDITQVLYPIKHCMVMTTKSRVYRLKNSGSPKEDGKMENNNGRSRSRRGTMIFWYDYISESMANFSHFANHLICEFAIENLLFMCEVIQWKYAYLTHCNTLHIFANSNHNNNNDHDNNNNDSNTNKTSIVNNNNTQDPSSVSVENTLQLQLDLRSYSGSGSPEPPDGDTTKSKKELRSISPTASIDGGASKSFYKLKAGTGNTGKLPAVNGGVKTLDKMMEALSKRNKHSDSIDFKTGFFMKFPKNAPRSAIVFGDRGDDSTGSRKASASGANENIDRKQAENDVTTQKTKTNETTKEVETENVQLEKLKQQAQQLCNKYINFGSTFEINISYNSRLLIMQKISRFNLNKNVNETENDIKEFLLAFEPAINEVKTLLANAFRNYQRVQDIKVVKDVFK